MRAPAAQAASTPRPAHGLIGRSRRPIVPLPADERRPRLRRVEAKDHAHGGRLAGAVRAQRHFVANASHELRTPLAAERTLLQVALADPDATAQALRSACEQVLLLGAAQERLIDALLTLATSERGLDRWEPFDLAEIAAKAIDDRRDQASQLGVRVEADLSPAPAVGDPSLAQPPDRTITAGLVHARRAPVGITARLLAG
jgi:signal transduction histidine kinase